MRAISLHEPHASFIAYGYKPFETRSWGTKYRGPLLIHAAQRRMDDSDRSLIREVLGSPPREIFPISYGQFVCIVDLANCHEAGNLAQSFFEESNGLGDFSAGRFAWELRNVRRFIQPIHGRGRQRFWNYGIESHTYSARVEPVNQIRL